MHHPVSISAAEVLGCMGSALAVLTASYLSYKNLAGVHDHSVSHVDWARVWTQCQYHDQTAGPLSECGESKTT